MATKTATRSHVEPVETAPPGSELVAVASSPLALHPGQTDWTPEQQAGLTAIGCGDAPVPMTRLFLNQCLRTGLDPFLKQIYLVPRPTKGGGKSWTIQVGIDGLRLLADRSAERYREPRGMAPTTWYDEDGKPYEAWVSSRPPAAAKVTVTRGGRSYAAVARTAAYMQTNRDGNPIAQWRTMPDVMIAKCAEALALRMAYPADLSGLYTDDEMGQASNPPLSVENAVEAPVAAPTVIVRAPSPDPSVALELARRAIDQSEPEKVAAAKAWADAQDLLDVEVTSAIPRIALEATGAEDEKGLTLGAWLDHIAEWLRDSDGAALSAIVSLGEPATE